MNWIQDGVPLLLKATPTLSAALMALVRNRQLLRIKKKPKELERFEFVEQFLDLPPAERHPLVIEQGLLACYGYKFSHGEWLALLKFRHPLRAFALFNGALSVVELASSGLFTFRDNHARRRLIKKLLLRLSYAVLVNVAILPIMFLGSILARFGWQATLPILLSVMTALPLAFLCLDADTSISTGEKLIEEQNKSEAERRFLANVAKEP